MNCENPKCNNDHDGSYGSGRFCSRSCANTNVHSEETKRRIGESLKERLNNPLLKSKLDVNTLYELSSRTIRKVLKRMNLGCSVCGWKEGVGDLHHINGRKIKDADNHNNLTYVCPNHHRLIHENKINKKTIITLEKQIGNKWKEYYYI